MTIDIHWRLFLWPFPCICFPPLGTIHNRNEACPSPDPDGNGQHQNKMIVTAIYLHHVGSVFFSIRRRLSYKVQTLLDVSLSATGRHNVTLSETSHHTSRHKRTCFSRSHYPRLCLPHTPGTFKHKTRTAILPTLSSVVSAPLLNIP